MKQSPADNWFAPDELALHPRNVHFDLDGSPLHWIPGDPYGSHAVTALNLFLPAAERWFSKLLSDALAYVRDDRLREEMIGFIGQESMHGQEHRHLNEKLIAMGYPIGWWDSKGFKDRRIRFEDRLPAHVHLAVTAAAEHYTAVLAERVLSSDELQSIPADAEVWHLLNWHALEELEHKSVAFDVFRAVGGTERTRITVMAAVCALLLPVTLISLAVSVGSDPVARRRPDRLVRETYDLFTGPIFKGLLPDLAVYLRPGFHPDDVDTTALALQWRDTLFGADGVLVDHLK